jgi:hypothetical protein
LGTTQSRLIRDRRFDQYQGFVTEAGHRAAPERAFTALARQGQVGSRK